MTTMIASVRSVSFLSAACAVAIAGGAALADEPTDSTGDFDHHVATVSNAFELSATMGYTQGTGDISQAGMNVADISGAGATFELKAGYRISPNFAFGGYGSFAKYTKANLAEGTDVYGATAGLWGDYHFRPDRSVDPVIGIASGFLGMWLSP